MGILCRGNFAFDFATLQHCYVATDTATLLRVIKCNPDGYIRAPY